MTQVVKLVESSLVSFVAFYCNTSTHTSWLQITHIISRFWDPFMKLKFRLRYGFVLLFLSAKWFEKVAEFPMRYACHICVCIIDLTPGWQSHRPCKGEVCAVFFLGLGKVPLSAWARCPCPVGFGGGYNANCVIHILLGNEARACEQLAQRRYLNFEV